ncbi:MULTISPECIES: NAD(P)-dependent oxidoreductase [unclassified Minwuia]|uniref:NAD(P)-dependent oxidoreductase n=1 Tax=unclassified Minwuia TaxID=2618799 RepID=UPI0024789146|nr:MULTISPECIES: NAD(P)-dependent oxidoreductase [unclassified Minwuia]
MIGVVGCGAMGQPMAEALLRAGFAAIGHDVRPLTEFAKFAGHMTVAISDLGRQAETVISVVRDSQQTRDVIDGLGLHQPPGQGHNVRTFIVSSTLSPRFVTSLRDVVHPEIALIDAPMSGAPFRARQGTLTFMLGGPEREITPLMPMFRAMGEEVHHLGSYGAGMAAKVLNNFVAANSVTAVRTVLAQAEALGLAPARLLSVMRSSSGGTWFGNNLDQIDWSAETHDPGNTIGILEKDVRAYLDGVSGDGTPDSLTAAVLDRLKHIPELPGNLFSDQEDKEPS